jgi:hypothetical protein
MQFDATRALIAYSGITTAALAVTLLSGAVSPTPDAKFGTIDVQRINIREPDGTLRLVASNTARAPGAIVKGKEYPHPSRKAAGMIFYNDEGTENGGLIFGGDASEGGNSYGSLTFDRYEQDQVVQLIGEQDGEKRRAGIAVFDRPEARFDYPAIATAAKLPPDRQAAALRRANAGGVSRLFAGRAADKSSEVALRDAAGHERLVLSVGETGDTKIAFLDADGKVTKTVTP